MEIVDRYIQLVSTYIYDKRTKMFGMLGEMKILPLIDGTLVFYGLYEQRKYE